MDLKPRAFTATHQDVTRDRVRAAFPRLLSGSNDVVSLTDFLDRRPERFFSAGACDAMATLLDEINGAHPDLLVAFFSSHHEGLKTAFRSLDEINRAAFHDESLESLGDALQRLSVIDSSVHPAYLRITESVLGAAILPVAQFERRKRNADEKNIDLHQRIQEVARGQLAPYMRPFERTVRNAIAHGGIGLRNDGVTYRDRTQSVDYSILEVFRLFDRALDVANGLLLAYRLFFAIAQTRAANAFPIPLPILIQELRAQVESSSWSVVGGLETDYGNDETGLVIFAQTTFHDIVKVFEATTRTAAVGERLAPNFAQYEVRLDRREKPAGVGVFSGASLRQLRDEGVEPLGEIASRAAPNSLLIFSPKPGRLLPVVIRRAGYWLEYFRSARRVTRSSTRPHVRAVKLHRKGHYLQVDAVLVLEFDDRAAATEFVRINAAKIVENVTRHARNASRRRTWNLLPVGFVLIDVFMRDARRRDLHGLGENLLGRIVRRRLGRIEVPPLFNSNVEWVTSVRIDWNTMPFGPDG